MPVKVLLRRCAIYLPLYFEVGEIAFKGYGDIQTFSIKYKGYGLLHLKTLELYALDKLILLDKQILLLILGKSRKSENLQVVSAATNL